MPHLSALNRTRSHLNRPLRLSEMSRHHHNSVFTCPDVSTSGRSTRQTFPSCKISSPPSLTSTRPTWFGSLWTTPASNSAIKRGVSISPVSHWLFVSSLPVLWNRYFLCVFQWRIWWTWLVPVCSGAEEPTRSWFYTVYMNVEVISLWV